MKTFLLLVEFFDAHFRRLPVEDVRARFDRAHENRFAAKFIENLLSNRYVAFHLGQFIDAQLIAMQQTAENIEDERLLFLVRATTDLFNATSNVLQSRCTNHYNRE